MGDFSLENCRYLKNINYDEKENIYNTKLVACNCKLKHTILSNRHIKGDII